MMTSLGALTKLAALASGGMPPEEAVQRALPLLQDGLSAREVQLVYGSEDSFRSFGAPASQGLSDVALWLINYDLTSRAAPCAFDLRNGRVEGFRSIEKHQSCSAIAAQIPTPISAGEMIIAQGPWSKGLSAASRRFLLAALPTLALLLDRRLDASRAEQQRKQLGALMGITRVMSESEDAETVLTSIAGTIATVTGINYVSIDIVDADGSVRMRCLNAGERTQELTDRWKRGATRPDPVRDEVLKRRRPLVFPDAQNDDRIPESGRGYFVRTLIRSTAVLPLVAKDEVLGVISVASHRPRDFASQEIELLEGLAAQVATTVKGIRLYQELDESRRKLQELNDQLQEAMGIQHHLARTDPLTGLPNRRYVEEAIITECARAARYDQPMSVAMADLDRLKHINDEHGHQAGDDALRFVAGVARQTCRAADFVGRWGGDEFVFILPSTGLDDAKGVAERFRHTLSGKEFGHAKLPRPVRLTISLGIAEARRDGADSVVLLIERADAAMYAAKHAGRDRTVAADNAASAA